MQLTTMDIFAENPADMFPENDHAESGDDVYEVAEVPRRLFAEAWPRCFRPALGGGSGRRAGWGGFRARGARLWLCAVRDGCARSPQHV